MRAPRPSITERTPERAIRSRASYGVRMSPLPITGTPALRRDPSDEVPVGRLAVALLAGPPVDRDRVGAALLAGPRHVRHVDLVLVPAGAQLDRHRDGDGALHGRDEPAELRGLAQQARPQAPARDLVDRAAAVEVHEARPARLREPGALDQGLGPLVGELDAEAAARPGGSSAARTRSGCPRAASCTTAISPTVTSAPISVQRRRKGRLPPDGERREHDRVLEGRGGAHGSRRPRRTDAPAAAGRGRLRGLLRHRVSLAGREEEVRLQPVLPVVHLAVAPARRVQLRVGAPLDDAAPSRPRGSGRPGGSSRGGGRSRTSCGPS